MAGGTTISFGSGSSGTSGMGTQTLDPLYYGKTMADAFSTAQSALPQALAAYQQPEDQGGGLSGDLDPELVQRAMRYIMSMPLESQYYETGLNNETGSYSSVKPMNYSSREQFDFVDQHEKDKEAYDTLIKDAKKRSSSTSSTTSQGTSVLSGDTSLTSLYQTLLGGSS